MSQPSFDLGFEDVDDASLGRLPTFTVAELAEAINGSLRRGFYEGVWVRGEIQGVSERNGHLYFSLTDDDEGVRATISVSLFANVRFKLRPLLQRHRLRLADGMKVRLHGYLDFFAPSGRLGLKMSGIDPRYTLGELALQRDELVRRLVAAGLYDAQARLASPVLPLAVGLVTSVGSAAWHDVTHELEASGFGFRIVACDARVQGEWAPEMVAAAIRTLGRHERGRRPRGPRGRCPVGPGHVRRRGRGPGHRHLPAPGADGPRARGGPQRGRRGRPPGPQDADGLRGRAHRAGPAVPGRAHPAARSRSGTRRRSAWRPPIGPWPRRPAGPPGTRGDRSTPGKPSCAGPRRR